MREPRLAVVLVLGIWLLVGGGTPAGAVQTTARCQAKNCHIVLTEVATLQEPAGARLLHERPGPVVRHKTGHVLARTRTGSSIALFDPHGRFVRVIGKPGEGAGEFRGISHFMLDAAGGIWVYDLVLRRLTPITSTFELGASVPFPYAPAYGTTGGHLVVAEQIRTSERIGYPIHLTRPDGEVIRSFGADVPQFRGDLRAVTDRRIAPAANGSVWAVAPGRYVIEQWNTQTGQRHSRVIVKSPWFVETTIPSRDERVRPHPLIDTVWEQGGLLWVLIVDADAAWKAPANANTERTQTLRELDQTFDWVLEIIDPATGSVVANRRLPNRHKASPSTGLLVSTRRAKDGADQYVVWQTDIRER